VTARLAIHEAVKWSSRDVLARLTTSSVDVEVIPEPPPEACPDGDPLAGLREGHLDLAVVGIRALRGAAAEGCTLLAVLPREEPRDVVVVLNGEPKPLRDLPPDARVAVDGARRAAFVRAHRPDVEIVELGARSGRQALEGSGASALVLWAGEARRAGLGGKVSEMLDPRSFPPDPGRGAVAILGRHPIAEVTALDHLPTRTALRAELALLDALDVPEGAAVGSLAQPSGRILRLWAAAASLDGHRVVRADLTAPLDEPEQLGASVARAMTARGVALVLDGAAA
jgi:hydroxymethylbilane synthase